MSLYEIKRENTQSIKYVFEDISYFSHFHQNLEFIYSFTENFTVIVDGKKILLMPNELLIIDSYSTHNIISKDKAICLVIPINLTSDFFAIRKNKVFEKLVVKDNDDRLLKTLISFENSHRNNYLTNKGLVNVFLGELINFVKLMDGNDKKELLMINIIKYLNENFTEDITLDLLAKKFNYSKYTISHYFKSQTGMTLNNYLNNVRLNNFIERMATNKATNLTRIISECGFTSIQTFYRMFKSIYKTSPKKYFNK